jgi:lysophospholipase L1-like esterase
MMAYETLLQAAMASGVRVLIYVAPIGSDHGERPYVESEYRHFKDEVAVLSRRYGAQLENFEDLISEPLWGLKDSTIAGRSAEPDFMHFTAAGHRVLAEQIDLRLFANISAPERAR